MKNTNKLFALFMTLLIALPLLFSCAPATSGSQNTTGADVSTDAPPFEKTGKTYDGADYNVLLGSLAGDCFNDFKYVEEEPTVLDAAIQKKNVQVETEFDVKIVYTEKFKTDIAIMILMLTLICRCSIVGRVHHQAFGITGRISA